MLSQTLRSLFLGAILAGGAGSALATAITFEDVPENIFWDPKFYPDKPHGFTSNGYVFTMASGLGFIFDGDLQYSNVAYNRTSIFDLIGTVTIRNALGHRFSVERLDFATFISDQTSTVRFTGTHLDGSTITRTYATAVRDYYATDHDFETKRLNGFNNLTSFTMEIVQMPEVTYAVAFDNIVMEEKTTGRVPEPSAPALVVLGLGLIAGLARRRKPR